MPSNIELPGKHPGVQDCIRRQTVQRVGLNLNDAIVEHPGASYRVAMVLSSQIKMKLPNVVWHSLSHIHGGVIDNLDVAWSALIKCSERHAST